MQGLQTAWQTWLIMMREGVEAVLALVGLELFLVRQAKARRGLYLGVALAVFVGLPFSAAVVTEIAIEMSRLLFNEWIEFVLLIFAAAFMLAVAAMLADAPTLPRSPKWERRIEVAAGTWWVAALASFAIVYREGVEAILFIVILNPTLNVDPNALALGITLALVCLFAIYMGLRYSARSLVMLRPILIGVAIMLFVVGLHFVGETVGQAQKMDFLATTAITGPLSWFDSVQQLIGQLIAAAVTASAALAIHRPRRVFT